MSDKEYYVRTHRGTAYGDKVIIGTAVTDCITATPAQIYAALDAVGREVATSKPIKVKWVTTGTDGCVDCEMRRYAYEHFYICDLFDVHIKCEDGNDYEVILRKRGGV